MAFQCSSNTAASVHHKKWADLAMTPTSIVAIGRARGRSCFLGPQGVGVWERTRQGGVSGAGPSSPLASRHPPQPTRRVPARADARLGRIHVAGGGHRLLPLQRGSEGLRVSVRREGLRGREQRRRGLAPPVQRPTDHSQQVDLGRWREPGRGDPSVTPVALAMWDDRGKAFAWGLRRLRARFAAEVFRWRIIRSMLVFCKSYVSMRYSTSTACRTLD